MNFLSLLSFIMLAGFSTALTFSLPIGFGYNATDDIWSTVKLTLDGQELEYLLDSASTDLVVAGSEGTGPAWNNLPTFQITPDTNITKDVWTLSLGPGYASGNLTYLNATFDGVTFTQSGVMAFQATDDEFMNGRFSGILGFGMRNISTLYHFLGANPMYDTMAASGQLSEPLYSTKFPRWPNNDESNQLSIGGIHPSLAGLNFKYNPVTNIPAIAYPDSPVTNIFWTQNLTGLRVNGKDISMIPGYITPGAKVALIDSGAPSNYFNDEDRDAIIQVLNVTGDVLSFGNGSLAWPCETPQLFEYQFGESWYAVDPLDWIAGGQTVVRNGKTFCLANFGSYRRSGGDLIVGLPFLRSVGAVFDWQSFDYTVQPRVGLASLVDKDKALRDYPQLWRRRMNI